MSQPLNLLPLSQSELWIISSCSLWSGPQRSRGGCWRGECACAILLPWVWLIIWAFKLSLYLWGVKCPHPCSRLFQSSWSSLMLSGRRASVFIASSALTLRNQIWQILLYRYHSPSSPSQSRLSSDIDAWVVLPYLHTALIRWKQQWN